MQEKSTYELDKILENTKPSQMDNYYKENSSYMADKKKGFYYYYKNVLDTKGISQKDVCITAGVSYGYGEKVIRMEKHAKNRDLIIRLCIAGHFNVLEIDRALKLYGMSPLYSKDKRDACIIVAINNRKFDLADIDDILEAQGQLKLSVDME